MKAKKQNEKPAELREEALEQVAGGEKSRFTPGKEQTFEGKVAQASYALKFAGISAGLMGSTIPDEITDLKDKDAGAIYEAALSN